MHFATILLTCIFIHFYSWSQGLVVSLFSVGCFIGALLSGGIHYYCDHVTLCHVMRSLHAALSDPIGRKSSIIVGGAVFFVGGALQAASYYLW